MIRQRSKATHIRVESQVCMHSLYKILNEDMHRNRAVKIESLAVQIFLDSKEVCVKLDNSLNEKIVSII